jgi:hypothetical protein
VFNPRQAAPSKLEVAIYAEENGGNMAAQRKYGVNEKVIRGWRKQKETLRMTKKSRKAFRVHAPHWPTLEDQLEEFVRERYFVHIDDVVVTNFVFGNLLLYKGTE